MKETLEEAAENSFLANKLWNSNSVEKAHYTAGFIEGAKWQQERSYSEEEVEIILETLSKVIVYQGNDYRLPHYFEFEIEQVIKQFKKK